MVWSLNVEHNIDFTADLITAVILSVLDILASIVGMMFVAMSPETAPTEREMNLLSQNTIGTLPNNIEALIDNTLDLAGLEAMNARIPLMEERIKRQVDNIRSEQSSVNSRHVRCRIDDDSSRYTRTITDAAYGRSLSVVDLDYQAE